MSLRERQAMTRRSPHALTKSLPQPLIHIIVGVLAIILGLAAMPQTMMFLPWALWRAAWPFMVAGAGLLLLLFGGRGNLAFGLALLAIGGIFLLGSLISLTWLLLAVFWPVILILVGVAIIGAGLNQPAR